MKNHSRFAKKNSRNYAVGKTMKSPHRKFKSVHGKKIRKVVGIIVAVFFVLFLAAILRGMWFLQTVSKDLPSPDAPFGIRDESSILYATSSVGTNKYDELYKFFGDENLDFAKISEVPDVVKWSVLAAEDIDFYEHPGFDIGGLIRAALYQFLHIGSKSGGSTITQQLIKQTALTNERTITRKIKELILSLQVERKYSKDQILEMYLNVNNYGSNIYGIKTAAKFYFGKELKDLTLAQAAVLARIPQRPFYNSPTLAPDPKKGKARAKIGQNYVFDQMLANLNKINDHIKSDDNIILAEEIAAARKVKLKYLTPKMSIKAPHYVFYIKQLLTSGNYNNGKPFELADLETGGYRIYTSLNTSIQKIAEEEVLAGVNNHAIFYGGHNGAVIITKPDSGDILAMVGSKDYFAPSEAKLFDGKVNVTDTLQSMGSSMKPMDYYKAFQLGIVAPGSYLPDVSIEINGYKPKNWNGQFKGPEKGAIARLQLRESRNIPAVILADAMGVNAYEDTLIKWGYKTIEKSKGNYGPSIVLGGGDVTMLEHVQGYGVLANGGQLVRLDPIERITKINNKTGKEDEVYKKEVKKEPVADQRAIYMVNHILNYKNGGPGQYIDGRDYAGKTGTTEESKDTIFVGYTPDFVILGWNGNNDNTPMASNAYGENVTKPWVVSLSKRLAPFFPEKRVFSRPGGIISGNSCGSSKKPDNGGTLKCAEGGGDLLIAGKIPPAYIYSKIYRVCTDQPTKLARDIDESLGLAEDLDVKVYKMASPSLQSFLDAAVDSEKLIPTEPCDIPRSPNGNNPWGVFSTPQNNDTLSGIVDINIQGYSPQGAVSKIEIYFGQPGTGTLIGHTNNSSYTGTLDLSGYDTAKTAIYARVFDDTGAVSDTVLDVNINGTVNSNLTVTPLVGTITAGMTQSLSYTYTGGYVFTRVLVSITDMSTGLKASPIEIPSGGSVNWTPSTAGDYEMVLRGFNPDGSVAFSPVYTVTVVP